MGCKARKATPTPPEAEGKDRKWKYKRQALQLIWARVIDTSLPLLEPEVEEDHCCPGDWPELPGPPPDQDAKELLGLPPEDWPKLPRLPLTETWTNCWGCH